MNSQYNLDYGAEWDQELELTLNYKSTLMDLGVSVQKESLNYDLSVFKLSDRGQEEAQTYQEKKDNLVQQFNKRYDFYIKKIAVTNKHMVNTLKKVYFYKQKMEDQISYVHDYIQENRNFFQMQSELYNYYIKLMYIGNSSLCLENIK